MIAGILEIIFFLFILWVCFQILIKIISSPWGAFLIIFVPAALFLIRLNYLWDMFSATQELFLPNPLSPDGFLYNIFADIIGRNLDKLFGGHFFSSAFAWILGALDYVVLLAAIHWLFYKFYLSRLAENYRWWWLSYIIFIVWLLLFHGLFYERGFKSLGFDPLARPDEMTKYCPYFDSYYWISMFLAALYVTTDIRKRRP